MPVTPVPKLTAEEPQVNVEVSADALPSPIVVAPVTVSATLSGPVSNSPAVIVRFPATTQANGWSSTQVSSPPALFTIK